MNFYEDIGCPCKAQYFKAKKLLDRVNKAIEADDDDDEENKKGDDSNIDDDNDNDADNDADDDDDYEMTQCEPVDDDYCFKHIIIQSIEMTEHAADEISAKHDELWKKNMK